MSVCSTALFCALRNIPVWAYIIAFLLLKCLTSVASRGIRGLRLRLRPSIKAEKNGISREVAAEADRDRGDRSVDDRGVEESAARRQVPHGAGELFADHRAVGCAGEL